MAEQAVLWGREHHEYGAIALESPVPNVAIALSIGKVRKAYHHIDKNEDVVGAVVGEEATLLVVADGHRGEISSHVAVEMVLDQYRDGPPADPAEDELVDLFDRIGRRILEVTAGVPDGHDSRTTLALAFVSEATLRWAAIGDGPILVVRPGRGPERQLGVQKDRFVGYPMTADAVRSTLLSGREDRDGAFVAVVSDGVTDFTPAGVLGLALTDGAGADAVARGLLERAFAGGAGDNVAVAVAVPPSD